MDHQFQKKDLIGIYPQFHNVDIDQPSLKPAVTVRYPVLRGNTVIRTQEDPNGQTVEFASGQRLVPARAANHSTLHT